MKPANMLFDGSDRLQVVDFGIARLVDETRGMTLTGTILGTAGYLAPSRLGARRPRPRATGTRSESSPTSSSRAGARSSAARDRRGGGPHQRARPARVRARRRPAGGGRRRLRPRARQEPVHRFPTATAFVEALRGRASPERLRRRRRGAARPRAARARGRAPARRGRGPPPSWPPATTTEPRGRAQRGDRHPGGDGRGGADDRGADRHRAHRRQRRAGRGAQRRGVRAHAGRATGPRRSRSSSERFPPSRERTPTTSGTRPTPSTTSAARSPRSTAATRLAVTSSARSSCREPRGDQGREAPLRARTEAVGEPLGVLTPVVVGVLARLDRLPPGAVRPVPLDRLGEALLEGALRRPAEAPRASTSRASSGGRARGGR